MSDLISDPEPPSPSLKIIVGGGIAAGFLIINSLHIVPPAPEWLNHLLMTLAVIAVVHLFDHYFLIRETRRSLNIVAEKLVATQQEAMRVLERQSLSLQTMEACGVSNMYSSRMAASEAIMRAIKNPSNHEICLLGISLNDFVRTTDQNPLRETWDWLARTVKNPSAKGVALRKVRLLLIDPYSKGATLRSFSETKDVEATPYRLQTDVLEAAKYLLSIEDSVNQPGEEKILETRLYSLPPTMFLCRVDSTCFVQQYYFWNRRQQGISMPVMEFPSRLKIEGESLHHEMGVHFDFLFDYASIPVAEVVRQHNVGSEWGAGFSGLHNILPDSALSLERMAVAIRSAKRRVWLQGISCRSFLSAGPLSSEMYRKIAESKAEVRILLIDSNSDQAVFRSYREWLLNSDNQLPISEFKTQEHPASRLVNDTRASIETLRAWLRGFRNNKGLGWQPNVELREYQTSPYCFMLLCDDVCFVEPYNYGKVDRARRDETEELILSSEMPLFEFRNTVTRAYAMSELTTNRALPFDVLYDHFIFAFDNAPIINLVAGRATSA